MSPFRLLAPLLIAGALLVTASQLAPPNFWTEAHANLDSAGRWDPIDRALQSRTAGDVQIVFEGFDPARGADRTYATNLYYRGTFALHPRRIHAVPRDVIVNTGMDVLQWQRFAGREQDLSGDLGVATRVIARRGPKGGIGWEVMRLE